MTLVVVSTFTGGWVVGWSEDWRVMLNLTRDQSKLKLKFELSLAIGVCDIGFMGRFLPPYQLKSYLASGTLYTRQTKGLPPTNL